MKRLIVFLMTIFCFANFLAFDFSKDTTLASINLTYYAKIENASTYFYSLPLKGDDYKLFEIPASYFVVLYDDENQNFYKAKYGGIDGYVLKEAVTPIAETPNYPFATTSFRIFSPTYLYESASSDSEKITPLESLTIITTFYGQKIGDELIPSSTKIWYYCSYLEESGMKTGYVFSYFCDQFQKIQPNSEIVTPITEKLVFSKDDDVLSSQGLSSTAKAIIVVSCVIPCLIILLLLLKKKTLKSSNNHKILHKPRKDFYEFNEDDI